MDGDSGPIDKHVETPLFTIALALIPAMSAIIGGLFVFWKYLNDRNDALIRDEISRGIEVRKPFLDLQLQKYLETAEVVGTIVAAQQGSPEWEDAARHYARLFWTELSLVEDEGVKSAMEQFSKELKLYRDAPGDLEVHRELNQRAYRVARALRTSVEQAWSVQLGPVTDTKGQ